MKPPPSPTHDTVDLRILWTGLQNINQAQRIPSIGTMTLKHGEMHGGEPTDGPAAPAPAAPSTAVTPVQRSRDLLAEFERLIRRDPARRGLFSGDAHFGPLCPGHLAQAASDLARTAERVLLVSGFYVPHGTPPAAETDGPLGTFLLAAALEAAGVETAVLTDAPCHSAFLAGARSTGFPEKRVAAVAGDAGNLDTPAVLQQAFDDDPGTGAKARRLTHLIAVERPGPSHTADSLRAQQREGPAPVEAFSAAVPEEHRDRCHNMRGEIIDECTVGLHRLFEEAARRTPPVKTIGIGDGANEIGMGTIPWEDLTRRLDAEQAPHLPCRIATDWTVVAGTSNWGAYALAAGLLVLLERTDVLQDWNACQQEYVLQQMVAEGPAVDGVTGRREPTVDGLPFLTYIQPWEGIRRLLGFRD